MRRTAIAIAGLALLMVAGFASQVSAQSSIIGTVLDTSGAVLPGVSVDAASEALIEGTKNTVTNSEGQYRITDLRPGIYTVTFTLNGFQTTKQPNLNLPGEFTLTVNASMAVGAVAETIIVTGTTTNVDVQSAVQITRLDRDALDNIPTGQNIWEIGQLISGIQLSTPSVGGSAGGEQTYMSIHGMSAAQNVVLVDGLTVSGLELNGAIQNYFNNDTSQELSYQTSGINADRSGGGVTVNMIPREGGNRFSGDGYFNYRPGSWIGDNFTQRLADMGATSANGLTHLSDFTVSQGGPIKKDALWFFASYHQFNEGDLLGNSFLDDGTQTTDDQRILQGSLRLTLQLGAKTKLSGHYEKIDKIRTHETVSANEDPETAALYRTAPDYSTATAKLTSTLSNRLLFTAGYSMNREFRNQFGQPGILQERGTPEWFANASRTTQTAGGPRTTAPSLATSNWPARYNAEASLSYVTARHNMKTGIQYQWGTFYHNSFANADLTQRYTNVTPSAASAATPNFTFSNPADVVVRNTPVESQDRLVRDLGIYAQDSWRLNRLTLNYGLRWENVVAQNDAYDAAAGRFVRARSIPAVENVPNYKDFAPRVSIVYDLFGNSKTAVKYAINRYNRSTGTALANTFNTLTSATRAVAWTDLNGNNIAEVPSVYDANGNPTYCTYQTAGCEIALDGTTAGSFNGLRTVRLAAGCSAAQLAAANANPQCFTFFGDPADASTYTPYERTWNLEQALSIEHQLTQRITIDGTWTHGSDHDIAKTLNRFRQAGDYREVTIFNPEDGTPITVYSIRDAETRTRLSQGGSSLTVTEPTSKSVFNEFAADFRIRPYTGAQVFGGWTMSRELTDTCGSTQSDPVTGTPLVADPNSLRFCDQFNLPDGLNVAWAHDFRVSGSFPLKWQGINFGFSYLNNDEGAFNRFYSIVVATTRYPSPGDGRRIAGQPAPLCPTTFGCTPGALVFAPGTFLQTAGSTTLNVDMEPNGSQRLERLQQVDIKLSKSFRFNKVRISPTLNVYNLLNSDHIISYQSLAYASSVGNYLIPNSVLVGRVIGIETRVSW